MAKTTAPLLGFGASGAVADTIVYGTWRGIPYARRHVVPANPRSQGQTLTRDIFRMMSQMWKQLPSGAIAPWNTFATGRPFLGVNAFTGQNIRVLRDDPPLATMANFIGSPGARGGPAIASVTLTPGTDEITAELVTPTPPTGWSLTGAQGIAFLDQVPGLEFNSPIIYEENLVAPYDLEFTGLESAEDYVVSVWLQWEKPDGQVAYSIGATDVATAG